MPTYKVLRGTWKVKEVEKPQKRGDIFYTPQVLANDPARIAKLSDDNITSPKEEVKEDPIPGKSLSGFGKEELQGMTVANLRELAEAEEVDLLGASTKPDIINRILGV